jgi:hypothetical protein
LAYPASATRAADRGVAIRIYLDGTQLAEREPAKVFRDLAETPGVEIRRRASFKRNFDARFANGEVLSAEAR